MGYSTGMLKHRVEVLKLVKADSEYGAGTGAQTFEWVCCVWADVSWKKGVENLNEGALDGVDTVMFRMRWNGLVNRECFLRYEGVTYQIMSFHADKMENTVQITAVEVVR